MMMRDKQQEHVRDYFDFDSVKYRSQRYPAESKTSDQYSYVTRKAYVLKMLDDAPLKKGKILDIGCGPGIYTKDLLLRGWEVWGMDLSPKMLQLAERSLADVREPHRAHFSTGQAENLSFDSSFFDAVLCIGVLPYVESLEKALSEISRVLKPEGSVLFQLSNKFTPFKIEIFLKNLIKTCLRFKRIKDEDDRLRDPIRITHHNPFRFNQLCHEYGLNIQDFRYYDFRVPVLTGLFPGLGLAIGKRLESLGRSKVLGLLGAGYLVKLKKR